jgi:transketolase
MRAQFARAILRLAEEDDRVVLLTGDLGFTILEPFAEAYPDRFFNVGVAEQNMVGLATGLAEAGFVPFTYSIATFASLRPYEFIRNGPVLHQLPVRLVGVGGGLDYGHNGVTHYALEDVGVLRLQPGLSIIVPADPEQADKAVRASIDIDGPMYFRVGKEARPIPGLNGRFQLGRAALIGDGRHVAILALGPSAREAVDAAEMLAEEGIEATVAVVSTLNPTPVEDLAALLANVPLAVTVEGHYAVGGLGTVTAEVIADGALDCRLIRCGVKQMPRGLTGTRAYLDDIHGLTAAHVAGTARRAVAVETG